MLKFDSPVSVVPKVGPKYKKLLENLEIKTVGDLIYHFPFRYDDYSQIKEVNQLLENDIASVKGVLTSINNIFTRNGKRMTKARVRDATGEIDLIFFNQHYLKTVIFPGKNYTISGKVGTFAGKPCFISPEIEEDKGQSLSTGRVVPIYSETAGVSSKWLRTRIYDVVTQKIELEEFLPEKTLKKQKINDFKWAVNQIHFPDNLYYAEKAKERFAFEEIFLELLKVEKRKHDWHAEFKSANIPKSSKIETFIKKLPFELTESQGKAVNEILSDTALTSPMNRLLEGDVGSGKTIVALIAAYNAHLAGFRTLYMAPTEILANQHYETFKEFLKDTGVKVELATSTTKTNMQDFDILIGTHAILFSDKKYEEVGLVVIDEQHRFGVGQRGKILDMAKNGKMPHLLSMTATPIPRTLALTLYGDLAISVLAGRANNIRRVATKVITEKAREQAYQWISQKNEPTFIVCPLIEESESTGLESVRAAQAEYKNLSETFFKDKKVGLLHGRMPAKEKQQIIDKFRSGEIQVLVSTPVIEVGIDIPDATIIAVESAERYGLASLHQLRGRVGRGQKEGFCFTIMSSNSKNAFNRLKHLEKIDNGIELAELDMKLRGQGDIFGAIQHGFKKFKVADLANLELLESAKTEAQDIFKSLDLYPKLKERLTQTSGEYISNN